MGHFGGCFWLLQNGAGNSLQSGGNHYYTVGKNVTNRGNFITK